MNEALENDSFNISLTEDWALGADSLQWILKKRVKTKKGDIWIGQRFIASEKRFLERSFKDKGIVLSENVQAQIDALPATFKEFAAEYKPRSKKGRKKGKSKTTTVQNDLE